MGSKEYEGPIGGPPINPPEWEDYRQCDLCQKQHTRSTCNDQHCQLCKATLDVCSECAEKLEWSLSVLLMAKAKKWNLLHPELVNEDAQILFDMINNIEL